MTVTPEDAAAEEGSAQPEDNCAPLEVDAELRGQLESKYFGQEAAVAEAAAGDPLGVDPALRGQLASKYFGDDHSRHTATVTPEERKALLRKYESLFQTAKTESAPAEEYECLFQTAKTEPAPADEAAAEEEDAAQPEEPPVDCTDPSGTPCGRTRSDPDAALRMQPGACWRHKFPRPEAEPEAELEAEPEAEAETEATPETEPEAAGEQREE